MTKSYTNFSQWEAIFDREALAEIQVHNKVQEQAVRDFFDKVVERTPIGKPETWINPPKRGYVPGKAKAGWAVTNFAGNTWTVYNDEPYIQRLEEGWSRQAPIGMMRITILEWPIILKKAERKVRGF